MCWIVKMEKDTFAHSSNPVAHSWGVVVGEHSDPFWDNGEMVGNGEKCTVYTSWCKAFQSFLYSYPNWAVVLDSPPHRLRTKKINCFSYSNTRQATFTRSAGSSRLSLNRDERERTLNFLCYGVSVNSKKGWDYRTQSVIEKPSWKGFLISHRH